MADKPAAETTDESIRNLAADAVSFRNMTLTTHAAYNTTRRMVSPPRMQAELADCNPRILR